MVINVDSFNVCKNYWIWRTVSTGGEYFTVTLKLKSKPYLKFNLSSYQLGNKDFPLKNYLICYKILSDKLPNEIAKDGMFSSKYFREVVFFSYKMMECEDYYYKEFSDQHPEYTPAERRQKKDWNFVEYMKSRKP